MEYQRQTIGAHTICNGQYTHQRNKREKVIKRSQFKERKKAYIHAKAAYEACMNTSTDSDEETSNSDNDEDSNKSVSTYSSEDSNIS
jgi:chaperonin cofactor prefoldin